MEAVVAPEDARKRAADVGRGRAWRPRAAAAAGPVLIALCVLFALRAFAFSPLLTNQQPDILSFWLPRLSFLGRSIAAGHVPLWNPFEMVGTRFAADPQSGWLYATPMALFSTLSPSAAMRGFIVFNPTLAGLGAFWFLRKEDLPRVAATAGGLALAMPISTSVVAVSMPFAGAIAWTTLVLVAASGFRRASAATGRIAWLGLGAAAWSQVATAHMSHGLGICTLLVGSYLAVGAATSVRAGELSAPSAVASVVGFLAFLPLASVAVLLPRIEMISASSLQAGYGALAQERAAGLQDLAIKTNGVWAAWPLAAGSAPGAFVGAVTLVCLPMALRSRRHRVIVWAFGGAAGLTYLLTLNVLVTADWFRALVLKVPYGSVYLHNPGRLRYVWMIALPVLGAVGLAGLIERRPDRRTILCWLAVTAGVFLVLPLAMGGHPVRFVPLAIGIAAAVPLLIALARGKAWVPAALVGLLTTELLASAIFAQLYRGGTIYTGLESGVQPNLVPQVLRWPEVPESNFLRPTAFVSILRHTQDRYLTWVQPAADFVKGYLFAQQPRDWPALAMERGTLFGIHDVLGYNPVQLVRYWSYIRETDRLSVFYNASVINEPTLSDVRLLGVRYLIVPVAQDLPPDLAGRTVATADGYDLVDILGSEHRVSVVPDWSVVRGAVAALHSVVVPGFDPARQAVLEAGPGIRPTRDAASGFARYQERSPEDVRVTVDAAAPSIVLVRNTWDAGWSATVDGNAAPVLPTDGFLQGVPVSAGRHDVRLVYRDPAIGEGLEVSGAVWALWAIGLGLALRRRRSARRRSSSLA